MERTNKNDNREELIKIIDELTREEKQMIIYRVAAIKNERKNKLVSILHLTKNELAPKSRN